MKPATNITILMPTLNAAAFLEEALASVASSTLVQCGVEVLVLDGVSTDATEAIVRKFDGLARFSPKRDGGMYEALNRGLREARGSIIGWLNADDTYDARGAGEVAKALLDDPSLDLAYGNYRNRKDAVSRRVEMFQHADALGRLLSGQVEGAWVVPLSTFWRRSALERIGGWDPTFRIAGDLELWMRAAALVPPLKARHVEAFVGDFRIHEGSMTTGRSGATSVLAEAVKVAELRLRDPATSAGVRAHLRQLRTAVLADWIWADLKAGDFAGARERWRRLESGGDRWLMTFASRASLAEVRAAGEKWLPRVVYERLRRVRGMLRGARSLAR